MICLCKECPKLLLPFTHCRSGLFWFSNIWHPSESNLKETLSQINLKLIELGPVQSDLCTKYMHIFQRKKILGFKQIKMKNVKFSTNILPEMFNYHHYISTWLTCAPVVVVRASCLHDKCFVDSQTGNTLVVNRPVVI